LCEGTVTCTSSTTAELNILSPELEKLLKEFGDVCLSDGPIGLSPFRGIEHQIDLFLVPVCPTNQHTK